MQTYRVYFMDSRSVIAAEMVEAASHGDAAASAVDGLGSYPWAEKLMPIRLEVWQGATFHQSAPVAERRRAWWSGAEAAEATLPA